MAKINPANVAPDAYPRIRGVLLTRTTQHGIIAQQWPKKRGPSKTPAAQFLTQQFALASRMAANSEPMQWETTEFMSRGTVWMPRDLLVMAAYGKLYELTGLDGTRFHQADHSAPEHLNPEVITVKQWHSNCVNGVVSAATSATAQAAKGSMFTPDVAIQLYKLTVYLTPVNGASYAVFVAACSGANVITSITNGPARTISGTAQKFYEFDCLISIPAGQRTALLLARTDGANTYALPVSNASGANWLIPCTDHGFARIAKAIPLVGDTVLIGANPYQQTVLMEF